MDLFTHNIRGWNLSRGLDQQLTLVALQNALQQNHPHMHYSDQGWQYASRDYAALLLKAHVTISMAEMGEPTQNEHAERLILTIKEEEV